MTAQDLCTMIRARLNPVIFLINNKVICCYQWSAVLQFAGIRSQAVCKLLCICTQGYTIQRQIRSGPYNLIHNWNYVKLVESLDNGANASWAARVQHF